jgi:multidrug resistance efflux pump
MPSLYENELQHAEDLQDVITAPPSWLMRWGIGIFFFFILGLASFSVLVDYPDSIKAAVMIRANFPPVKVSANTSGKIVTLLVNDRQKVEKGQEIALFESDVNYLKLSKLFLALDKTRRSFLKGEANLDLLDGIDPDIEGALEEDFLDFYQSYLTYRYVTEEKEQRSNSGFAERTSSRTNRMRTPGEITFLRSLNRFISQINSWKHKYILTAGESGIIRFSKTNLHGYFARQVEELFYIYPLNNSFYGEMVLPQNYLSKIKEGQQVNIRLKSYPHEEFGVIAGEVASINEISLKGNMFSVTLKISRIINNKIKLADGMLAEGDVSVANTTIYERLSKSLFGLRK